MKIVVNKKYGGFGLSDKAIELYAKLAGLQLEQRTYEEEHAFSNWKFRVDITNNRVFSVYELNRTDPNLVAVVEQLQDAANTNFSQLEVVEIPDNVEWSITERDGFEIIEEKHRTW